MRFTRFTLQESNVAEKNPSCIDDLPIKTFIDRGFHMGFPIATFKSVDIRVAHS